MVLRLGSLLLAPVVGASLGLHGGLWVHSDDALAISFGSPMALGTMHEVSLVIIGILAMAPYLIVQLLLNFAGSLTGDQSVLGTKLPVIL